MTIGVRRKSLLLVDDNINVQNELRAIAAEIGFEVTAVSSRRAAFDAISRRRFDAALVDMRLVEADPRNRDGMAILRHLNERREGTSAALLTGYGDYQDGVEATEQYHARQLQKGTDSSFEANVRRFLSDAMATSAASRQVRAVRAWCGDEDTMAWEMTAQAVLRPKGDIGVMLKVLEALALTCDPILERVGGTGIRKVGEGTLSGVFWSRGIGDGIVVTLKRDDVTSPLAVPPGWPPSIALGEELYRVKSRNLLGIVSRCIGLDPAEFSVPRPIVE